MLDKYIVESNFDKDQKCNQYVSFYLMILTNLTTSEVGQNKILGDQDKIQKGLLFLKFIDIFFKFIYNPEFNFCSNILANISSIKEGRYIILDSGLFAIFVSNFDKLNNHQLLNILRLVRNISFEYEKYIEKIFVQNAKIINILAKILILVNITDNKKKVEVQTEEMNSVYFTHLDANFEKSIINDLIIDILLVFTNLESTIVTLKEKKLKRVFDAIRDNLEQDFILKDRVFVITNYLDN